MSIATIETIRAGGAWFRLNGIEHWFPDWRHAVAEAESRGMDYVRVDPGESRVEVLAESPALSQS